MSVFPSISSVRQRYEQVYMRASDGRVGTFTFLLVVGLMVYAVLFSTIHNRSDEELIKHVPERYPMLIQFWEKRGYFKHGGLWVWSTDEEGKDVWNPPLDDAPVTKVYRSYSMGHVFFANIAQRLHIGITGRFSDTLMALHNQFFVLLSSVLLGFLAFRMGQRVGMVSGHALLLALSCQMIYQTFPVNLFYFWEVYPSTIAVPFILVFLIILEQIYHEENPRRKHIVGASICGFVAFYVDPPAVGFFFIFLALIWLILGNRKSWRRNWHKITIYPALCAIAIIGAQLVAIKISYPDIEYLGSNFWFRTGLDGATDYYTDQSGLLTRRDVFSFLRWYFLFFGGGLSFLVFMLGFNNLVRDKYIALVIFSLLCLYFPMAFVISQGVVIHPYYFDAYLAGSMVLLLFFILPMMFEKFTGSWGGGVILFSIIAFCYVFVQLRVFMVAYPR